MKYTELAPAKINLALDILRRRDDGYHDLYMIMQTVSLFDRVTLEEFEIANNKNQDKKFILETENISFPADYITLEERAAIAFFDEIKSPMPDMRVKLEKSIPAYAGLGGGSSDIAALLRLLRKIHAPDMPIKILQKIALRVSSDAPFCIQGGIAIAEGRGEILTRISPLPACWFVICKPDFGIPTPELFALADRVQFPERPDIDGMIRAVQSGDLRGIANKTRNVFEYALPDTKPYRQIFEIKTKLLKSGAWGTAMSGSGPSVFGLFPDLSDANAAADILKRDFPETFVVQPCEIDTR